MSFAQEILWSALRAAIVAPLALWIGAAAMRALRGLRGPWRVAAWTALLAPALTPSVVVGYTLTRGVLAGGARAGWGEAFYAAVLLAKLTPIAAVVAALAPPPVTPRAHYCFRLLGPHTFARRLRFHFHAVGRGPAAALALVFLLAFTEFELAAFCAVRSWTVALFDAHAGGLALAESLRLAALPAALEACALALLWMGLRGAVPARSACFDSAPRMPHPAVPAWLAIAAGFVTVWPLLRLARQAAPGLPALVDTFALGRDLAASVTFAGGASVLAWVASRALVSRPVRAALGSLPGLLGALVLALAVLAFFQLPAIRLAYGSPLPLLLALTLLLLPLAVLLRWILGVARLDSAMFLARQSGNRALLWRLDGRRRFAAWALLFCWAFFDFTAASILAPAGFTPVFVRLHNLTHYGQTAALSAMVCAALAVPLAVLALAGALARFHARHHGR